MPTASSARCRRSRRIARRLGFVGPTTFGKFFTRHTGMTPGTFRQTQQGYALGLTSAANFKPSLVTSRYIPKNNATAYVQSYFLSIQHQLPGQIVADIAYVGNKGTHLQILADYNQALADLSKAEGSTLEKNRIDIDSSSDTDAASVVSEKSSDEKNSFVK